MKISWCRLLAYTALLILACQCNAAAQNAPQIVSNKVERQAIAAAAAYWTPERMEGAVPMDLLNADSATVASSGFVPTDPGSAGSTPGEPPSAVATRFRRGLAAPPEGAASLDPMAFFQQFYGYPEPYSRSDVPLDSYDESLFFIHFPQSTIGKLFFTLRGTNFVCSASVVRPHLVLTARHCMFDGVFSTNVVFFPGWHSGPNTILGMGWPARIQITWACPCDIGTAAQFDIGFIQTFDDDGIGCGGSQLGLPIEAYTGFLGTAWAGNAGNEPVQHYTEVGYPQGAPFSGAMMVYSRSGTAVYDFNNILDTVGVGNDMTGGSSGGPWVGGWDEGSNPPGGGNFANGLNSYKWVVPNRSQEMNGPQFKDYNFNQLRILAEGQPCP